MKHRRFHTLIVLILLVSIGTAFLFFKYGAIVLKPKRVEGGHDYMAKTLVEGASPKKVFEVDHDPTENNHIQPYPGNPYYWQYKGRPIMLLGAGKDHNLFNFSSSADMVSYLDTLVSHGGNYVRQVMNELTEFNREENVDPYLKVSGRFDLTQFNPEYWERFADSLQQAYNRDIIVSIELWGTFWYFCHNPPQGCRWDHVNPFNPKNNINYNAAQSGLPESWISPDSLSDQGRLASGHPARSGHRHPFFRTVPSLSNNQLVLGYQHQWVRKILSYSLNYENVLYVIGNEVSTDPEWSKYWAGFVEFEAAKKGRKVFITEMFNDIDITGGQHDVLFASDSPFTFAEISQNNHHGDMTRWPRTNGDVHWNNLQTRRKQIANDPKPMNNIKIYGSETYGTQEAAEERFWRNIIGGAASARFHRQPAGLGNSESGLRNLRSAGLFVDEIGIYSCEPDGNFSLFVNRNANQVYACQAYDRYGLYVARKGQLHLRLPSGEYRLIWLDIKESRWLKAETIRVENADHPVAIKPPGSGFAAVLRRQNAKTPKG